MTVHGSCELCLLVSELDSRKELYRLGTDWYVNSYQGSGSRPRFVVQPQQHVTDVGQLCPSALQTLGSVMGKVCDVIKLEINVERVYVLSFNETAPGHIHFHFVPRFTSDINIGPALSDNILVPQFDTVRVLQQLTSFFAR